MASSRYRMYGIFDREVREVGAETSASIISFEFHGLEPLKCRRCAPVTVLSIIPTRIPRSTDALHAQPHAFLHLHNDSGHYSTIIAARYLLSLIHKSLHAIKEHSRLLNIQAPAFTQIFHVSPRWRANLAAFAAEISEFGRQATLLSPLSGQEWAPSTIPSRLNAHKSGPKIDPLSAAPEICCSSFPADLLLTSAAAGEST